MRNYEMFTDEGNEACEKLVQAVITEFSEVKLKDSYDLRERMLKSIGVKMAEVAKTHPEVWDTEPPSHIVSEINKRFPMNLHLERFEIYYTE